MENRKKKRKSIEIWYIQWIIGRRRGRILYTFYPSLEIYRRGSDRDENKVKLNSFLFAATSTRIRLQSIPISLVYTIEQFHFASPPTSSLVVSRRVILGASSVARAACFFEDGLMGVASNGKRFVLMRVVHFHGAGGRAGNVGNKLAGGIQRWRSSKSDIPLSPALLSPLLCHPILSRPFFFLSFSRSSRRFESFLIQWGTD